MQIQPVLASGFRDYLPAEMLPRQRMLDTIRGVYETFGFSPLETPAVEKREVLVGGDSSNIIYDVRSSESDVDAPADLALRFDLTVPLARVVAANLSDLPRPFRRYQCAKAWRGERPQLGRFREFLQFDADIVGSASPLADAETLWLVQRTLAALGVERFRIRFSSRKVLDALATRLGLDPGSDDARQLLRTLDKVDKIGADGVDAELRRSLPGLDDDALATVGRYLATRGTPEEVLAALPGLLGDGAAASEGTDELRAIVDALRALEVPEAQWTVDLSIVRGLGYYTGLVFETNLLDLPELGSVYSGGRYDGLVSRFSDAKLPAVGASVGFDRLYAGLEKLGLIQPQPAVTRVCILRFDDALAGDYLNMLRTLRDAEIPSELYVGEEKSFKAQLNYALKLEIPLVVIYGSEDAAKGVVQLKDTRSRTQEEIPVADLLREVQKRL